MNARVLASDLDGTLIPIADDPQSVADLRTLSQLLSTHDVPLIFVTGRGAKSVQNAIDEFRLPEPAWILCDVGTSIYRRDESGRFVPVEEYRTHLNEIISPAQLESFRRRFTGIDGLTLQEGGHQAPFKLSYYASPSHVAALVAHLRDLVNQAGIPCSVVHSTDTITGRGYIDVLPDGVSKASALRWWADHTNQDLDTVLFAGDSGNDLPVFEAGRSSIIVANAESAIARMAYDAHRQASWTRRLFFASKTATSGVLEGCRWFELFPDANPMRPERLGATPISARKTHFRVWSPNRNSVTVEVESQTNTSRHELQRHANGYFTGLVSGVGPDCRYRLTLDHQLSRPDPVSHFQPEGVHGVSQVVAHSNFPWQDNDWQGVAKSDLIIYELHVGTFTHQGTFLAAIDRIPELVELGVTAVELMPVAQSPGKWNWGYDGVNLFAVRNTYGTPDELRSLVDACHKAGLAVILDVVYNHLGPEGNYLADFAPYFSSKHHTPWGEAFDFDGQNSKHVRRFIVENAIHWIEDFHLDGLRLDAVHFMCDDGPHTILDELRERVDDLACRLDRRLHLIAEANVYDHRLVKGSTSSPPYDAIWCDDIMHSIYSHGVSEIALTHREYRGGADLQESLSHGFIYTGPQISRITSPQRDELHPTDDRTYLESLIVGVQTHDSVGNHPLGKRIHQITSPEFQKAAAALVLLYPAIPLIFMGEEFASSSLFPFFVDFEDRRLRRSIDRGRAREYPKHEWSGALSPSDPQAFHQAKCDDPVLRNSAVADWYRSLIAFRRRLKKEGVLDPNHLQASYDQPTSRFTLRYQPKRAPQVSVIVRLQSASVDSDSVVEIPETGEVVLNSKGQNGSSAKPFLALEPNHAVVLHRR